MDDTLAVRRGERVGDLRRDRQRLFRRQRSLLQALGEGLAGDVLHHEEHRTVVIADVVERADVRWFRPPIGFRLALEARAPLGDRPPLSVRQDLDGDRAIEAGVAGRVDFAHAACTDGGLDLIRPEARSRGETHGNLRAKDAEGRRVGL